MRVDGKRQLVRLPDLAGQNYTVCEFFFCERDVNKALVSRPPPHFLMARLKQTQRMSSPRHSRPKKLAVMTASGPPRRSPRPPPEWVQERNRMQEDLCAAYEELAATCQELKEAKRVIQELEETKRMLQEAQELRADPGTPSSPLSPRQRQRPRRASKLSHSHPGNPAETVRHEVIYIDCNSDDDVVPRTT